MPDLSNLTFLFTDIEGSTSKWEEQPELMAQAVACHDALLRDTVEAYRGRIVKTTGDGIYAAFASPAGHDPANRRFLTGMGGAFSDSPCVQRTCLYLIHV